MNRVQRAWRMGNEVQPRPWPEIAEHFAWTAEPGGRWLRPMLELVQRIAASPHAGDLFAVAAMHTLIVAGTRPFHRAYEVLRIDYDPVRDEFRFEYVERAYVEPRWRKRCPPAEAFGAVEHLARMKGWIAPAPAERPCLRGGEAAG